MKYLAFIFIISFTACESQAIRKEEYIAKHPEWDADTTEIIRQGYLLKGMTKEQVTAAWGKACMSCTGTTEGEWGETWEYPTQIIYFDKGGKVLRWSSK